MKALHVIRAVWLGTLLGGIAIAVAGALGEKEPAPSHELAPHPRRFDPALASCQDDGFERWDGREWK